MSYFSVGSGLGAVRRPGFFNPNPPIRLRVPIVTRPIKRNGLGIFVDAQGHPLANQNVPPCAGTLDAFGNCVTGTSLIAAASENPYLASAAYEATQGGTTPGQAAAATLSDYCKTSVNNAQVFGTPVDPECTGGAPVNLGVTLNNPTPQSLSVISSLVGAPVPPPASSPAAASPNAAGGASGSPAPSSSQNPPASAAPNLAQQLSAWLASATGSGAPAPVPAGGGGAPVPASSGGGCFAPLSSFISADTCSIPGIPIGVVTGGLIVAALVAMFAFKGKR